MLGRLARLSPRLPLAASPHAMAPGVRRLLCSLPLSEPSSSPPPPPPPEETGPPPRRRGPTPEERPPKDTSRKYVRVDEAGRAYSMGSRKRARAQVYVWESSQEEASITINNKNLSEWLRGHWAYRLTVLQPFLETDTLGQFSVQAVVKGGGLSGQAEAVRHGIATAMQGLDFDLRPQLKKAGYLMRDRRERERLKPGQTGARKKWTWVKR